MLWTRTRLWPRIPNSRTALSLDRMTAGVLVWQCCWNSQIPRLACQTAIVIALTLVQNWTALLKRSDFETIPPVRRLSEVSLSARPSFKLPSMVIQHGIDAVAAHVSSASTGSNRFQGQQFRCAGT